MNRKARPWKLTLTETVLGGDMCFLIEVTGGDPLYDESSETWSEISKAGWSIACLNGSDYLFPDEPHGHDRLMSELAHAVHDLPAKIVPMKFGRT